VIVEVQPVARAALPGWLERRLARQKQSASREVLEYLADRVEGNLLAAHQELQKLALLAPEGELSLDTVRGAVADVARYDTYVAAEALVAGDTARYLRVLEGLRGEGEAPTYLLFTLSSALFALSTGERVNKTMQSVLERARRYPKPALERAISRAAAVDRTIKGIDAGEPWEEFAKLGLELHAA
jgi:DNA polymerase-3 subunit delta